MLRVVKYFAKSLKVTQSFDSSRYVHVQVYISISQQLCLYLTLSVSETVQDNSVTFKSGSGVIQGN